ncbi:hypothetical protein NP233_g5805 [Leucocoprinus birnbaumii]|uniref:Transmembrane protein n=1 Tax=Leucocoprinus birnbaumii TaxID=56174 RepID=A0AAD5VS53_9AGAR|nr:hypothetical protein NP233_g5805 [Leucocoprinus birnbaumii]
MGKNWFDPAEIARDSRVYGAFVLVLSGMAAWDVIKTIGFDISVMRGKRPWRWPMVLYFITRICMILHIFAMAVNLNAIQEIPCQEVTWISKVTDAIGTCCSSLILVLRTRAVWHRDIKVTIGLGALFLGQIAVWCQTFRYSIARWDPTRRVCAVISTAPRPLLVTVFAYTMAFDLVILLLCAYRLSRNRRSNGLANLLLRDGIVYFCAVFGANLVQMIMACLALNPVMNIIALPFALVVSVIASTTVFRNVFIQYDAFSSDTSKNLSSQQRGISDSAVNRLGTPRINLTNGASHHVVTNDIPLGEYKTSYAGHHHYTHDTIGGGISVHKVVDVEVDTESPNTKSQLSGDDSLHEKGRAL